MGNLASKTLSAALAALFLLFLAFTGAAVHAAIPVEESVGEPTTGTATRETRARPLTRSTTRRVPSLDIPPTIEPSANPVVEVGVGGASGTAQPPTASAASDRGVSDMFYQMQILQQEIQDLRGQVEQQSYTIKRLQDDQKQQYLDLDRRVAALSGGAQPAVAARPSSGSEAATGGAAATQPGNERDAYRQAFDNMRAQRFPESKEQFQNLIVSYPNGLYTANAFYWIGEIFLVADQDAEQARQSFMQVINLYPDHQKAPDALYKLGVVHAALGENDTARGFLDRVQREHPNSSAAGLARKYVSELP